MPRELIPPSTKQHILSLHAEGKKGSEISAITGVSAKNIWTIVSRARKRGGGSEIFNVTDHENWIV